MTAPENTASRDPMLHLALQAGALGDGYIEGMEAAGQRQFVESSVIPTQCDEAALIALGFTLGDKVPGDDLFRHCTLPAGWRKAATDHSMHSDIVDELGRKRVGVFYKAAFYDRRADAHVVQLSGYLQSCAWDGTPVVYDDAWATQEAVAETAAASAADYRRRAAEYATYYPAGVADQEKIAARFEALAAAAREVKA
jgi:hypothetical protein